MKKEKMKKTLNLIIILAMSSCGKKTEKINDYTKYFNQLARGSASCLALNLPLAEITRIQTFDFQISKTTINFPL
jgi:Tfp pilus assembly protein PilP